MCHPFFDELRDPRTKLPDSRHPNGAIRDLPELFNFTRHGMYLTCPISLSSSATCDDLGISFGKAEGSELTWCLIIELSIAPELNAKLIPAHAKAALAQQGIDLENFTPLTKEEMSVRLD
jgi:glycogen synthase kinase 3 beta